jgi:AcrR family transcriptional regulator
VSGVNVSASSRRKRVPALPPEDRRAALIKATIPLLEQHGSAVTTRQIADAAGVAEGTIFGVFPDKASLIRAAVIEAFAPDEAVRVLTELSQIADLRDRIAAIVEVLNFGTSSRIRMMSAVRSAMGPQDRSAMGSHDPDDGESLPAKLMESRNRILQAVAEAIERDADRLRVTPAATARIVMTMVFASQSDGFGEIQPIASTELSSLLLDGLLVVVTDPGEAPPTTVDTTNIPDHGDAQC